VPGKTVPWCGTVPGYPVNVAVSTGKVREFDVILKVVTLKRLSDVIHLQLKEA